MFCAVYKSLKKQQTYLYVEKKDDFSKVPQELLTLLGQLELVMLMAKRPEKDLVQVTIDELADSLSDQGYHLQLPPPPIDHFKQHKQYKQEKLKKEGKR